MPPKKKMLVAKARISSFSEGISAKQKQLQEIKERIERLSRHPAHYLEGSYLDIHYFTDKKGNLRKRDFESLQRKNAEKISILKVQASRLADEISGLNAGKRAHEGQLRTVEQELKLRKEYLLNKAEVLRRLKRFSTKLGNEQVFYELINSTQSQLAAVLKRLKVNLVGSENLSLIMKELGWRTASMRSLSALYAALLRDSKANSLEHFRKPLIARFEEAFRAAGIKTILEVGPADRGMLFYLADLGILKSLGIKAFALDLAPERQKYSKIKGINRQTGDITDIASIFPGQKFDAIVSAGVFTHGGTSEGKKGFRQLRAESGNLSKMLIGRLSHNPNGLDRRDSFIHPS